jgi:hypothetical protein
MGPSGSILKNEFMFFKDIKFSLEIGDEMFGQFFDKRNRYFL